MEHEMTVLSLPRLLSEEQVAAALGCSPDTVRRERKRGRLGFTKVGGRIRYAEDQMPHISITSERTHALKA